MINRRPEEISISQRAFIEFYTSNSVSCFIALLGEQTAQILVSTL